MSTVIAPTRSEQLYESAMAAVRALNVKLDREQTLARSKSPIAATSQRREAEILDAIARQRKAIAELRFRVAIDRGALDVAKRMKIIEAEKVLRALHDRWTVDPPDWESRKRAVLQANVTCDVCQTRRPSAVRHRIPVVEGGTYKQNNLLALCAQCQEGDHQGLVTGGALPVSPRQASLWAQVILALRLATSRVLAVVCTVALASSFIGLLSSGPRVGAICRDGWRSSAIGLGACSHHGGVDHWIFASSRSPLKEFYLPLMAVGIISGGLAWALARVKEHREDA